ncbi:TPA: DUF2063 domain-containing protein [Legionella pneumophila]|nr:DUF2063 domain-containing protein [Legionella pneumophila]
MKQEKCFPIPTIKQIQSDFVKAMFKGEDTELIKHLDKKGVAPELRLSIYRNNFLQNLNHALELTFPGVWKLVGKECADNLAYAFCQNEKNLPQSNCLDNWGAHFPLFLQEANPVKHLIYLRYIAELEWLAHKSYCALDFKTLNPMTFQHKLDKHGEQLCLLLNPSLHLFSSPYLLKEIIDLIEGVHEGNQINLQQEVCYAVINRQYNQVVTHWVTQDLYDFFTCINSQFSLKHSYELIVNKHPDFNLVEALQFMLKNHLITKCRLNCYKRSKGNESFPNRF